VTDWRQQGNCVGMDPNLFFPERGDRVDDAVGACQGCPVKEPCLEWGLHHEKFGIWGGTNGQERRVLRRERGILLNAGDDFGGPLGELSTHGTAAGYARHQRAGDVACVPCRQAHAQSNSRCRVVA
jgi:WhiB family redox-sensing transcriptional regulator